MKKTIVLFLLFTMFFTLCSCSSNTVDDAVKEADKLVDGWHKEGSCGCIFRSEFNTKNDGYESPPTYIVYARYPAYINEQTGATAIKNMVAQDILKELYPQLVEVFKDYKDVSIAFILSDENGNNTHCTILDGEIIKA